MGIETMPVNTTVDLDTGVITLDAADNSDALKCSKTASDSVMLCQYFPDPVGEVPTFQNDDDDFGQCQVAWGVSAWPERRNSLPILRKPSKCESSDRNKRRRSSFPKMAPRQIRREDEYKVK